MSFLAIIMLAAGLHPALPATPSTMSVTQTKVAVTRQMAAIEATAHRATMQKALASSSRAFNRSLQRQLATTRVHQDRAATPVSRQTTAAQRAKVSLDREIAQREPDLRQRAVSNALQTMTDRTRASLETQGAPKYADGATVALSVAATQPE